ncbi:hypothetical protein HG530_013414 [Fusarium avenaceum]|nr:hypothetical protein HG530_013414 [Fusarium avenaceum]
MPQAATRIDHGKVDKLLCLGLKRRLIPRITTALPPSFSMVNLPLGNTLRPLSSPRTSSRCADDDTISSFHRSRVLGSHIDTSFLVFDHTRILLGVELFQRRFPVRLFNVTDPKIQATLSIATSVQSIGVVDTALAEDGDLKGNSKLNVTNNAIATAVLASSSRTGTNRELAEKDGISTFKYLRVCDTSVGHMTVNTACTLPVRTCTASTSNCLVVSESFYNFGPILVATKPKGKIVAAALAGSTSPESLENHVVNVVRQATGAATPWVLRRLLVEELNYSFLVELAATHKFLASDGSTFLI